MINIANQPYPSLAINNARLEKLSDQIMKNWKHKYNNRQR